VHAAELAQEGRGRVDAHLLAVVHEEDVVGLEGVRPRRVAAALGVDRRRVRRIAVVHAPDVGVQGRRDEPTALHGHLDTARARATVIGGRGRRRSRIARPETVEGEVVGDHVRPARDLDGAEVLTHRDEVAASLGRVLGRRRPRFGVRAVEA